MFAEQNGADVREENTVLEADITSAPDAVSVTSTDAAGKKTTHRARFLIDASGREAFIGAKAGWRKPRA